MKERIIEMDDGLSSLYEERRRLTEQVLYKVEPNAVMDPEFVRAGIRLNEIDKEIKKYRYA